MKEGRKRFVAELRKQLRELQDLCQLNPAESFIGLDEMNRIYRIVHTIKGSAPMFGFVRIGSVAEKLVHQWEWIQESEALALPAASVIQRYQASVLNGDGLRRQLSMELDVYSHELELDEEQEHRSKTSGYSSSSRLLVIDDDDVLRSYLVRRLRLEGYEVDDTSTVEGAQRLLREHSYELITLDLMMHPQSGYALFEFVKEDPTLKWVPLVVLSGRDDLHDKIRCFYLGADDYVTKPFEYEELSARIYSLLKRTKNFEQMAFRDPLTGVYNRRFFDHQIQVELKRVSRYPASISMVFIDIDRFKCINDKHGHHVGDIVLQGMAHMLQKHLRATDLLARFGGEEFVVVLPGTSAVDAKKAIHAILQQAHKEPVAQYEGQAYYITFSAGVCEWSEGMELEDWIKRADGAMYTAKQSGRNQVLLYEEGMTTTILASPESGLQRKKVLIADDDRILRSILISKLQHLPIDFVEAADGLEALDKMTQQFFHLCILDGVMPRLDGIEVLEKLGARTNRAEGLQVLLLSGRSREEDVSRALELGIEAYMHKPFSMVELEVKVKQLLKLV
ncbi:diguanylate cyclase [Paenibacillus rigui]|uniref:Diguanylate cyclase n=1 Tax=Paenibacillus rigui TaxID=554312 RepID=A0A229UPL9_9BACL|nr:diguanylate cyclase [Paenibacillus rigui]OXM85372.1 diguanylate cyclase [Paenibacillus rigui]